MNLQQALVIREREGIPLTLKAQGSTLLTVTDISTSLTAVASGDCVLFIQDQASVIVLEKPEPSSEHEPKQLFVQEKKGEMLLASKSAQLVLDGRQGIRLQNAEQNQLILNERDEFNVKTKGIYACSQKDHFNLSAQTMQIETF